MYWTITCGECGTPLYETEINPSGRKMNAQKMVPFPRIPRPKAREKAVCPICKADLRKAAITNGVPTVEPEIGAEPIVAWRAWNVVRTDISGEILEEIMLSRVIPIEKPVTTQLRLVPLNTGNPYPPERYDASCLNGTHSHKDHIVPGPGCTCGVYALKERDAVIDMGQVYGEVYLWGRVIEANGGYRAQYAYPKRLCVRLGGIDMEKVNELSRVYRIPVEMVKASIPQKGGSFFYNVIMTNTTNSTNALSWGFRV